MATFIVDLYLMKKRLFQSFSQYISVTRCIFTDTDTTMHQVVQKPPNILVYSPCSAWFCEKLCPVSAIEKCLPANKYVAYRLSHERCSRDPWIENAQLLIIPATKNGSSAFSSCEIHRFSEFLNYGGKILNFSKEISNAYACSGERRNYGEENYHIYDKDTDTIIASNDCWTGDVIKQANEGEDSGKITLKVNDGKRSDAVAILCQQENGGEILHCALPVLQSCSSVANQICSFELNPNSVAILMHCMQQLGILDQSTQTEQDSRLETPCFLECSDKEKFQSFFYKLGIDQYKASESKGTPTLCFCPVENFDKENLDSVPAPTGTKIPIIYQKEGKFHPPCDFDWTTYFEHLQTRDLGKIVLYSDIVTSTMDLLEPLQIHTNDKFSIVCIAKEQTKGKGRGGNKWISPLGMGMFSLTLSIPLQSHLGKHLSILQHIVTVAAVHSIRSIQGLHDVDLRVKWPNDIYFGSGIKIGGVLVKSTILKSHCIVTIGCGVNLSNSLPTTCVNDIIKLKHPEYPSLKCEEFLARTINCLEQIINKYQRDGPTYFHSLYYQYWIHSDKEVQVQLDEFQIVDATITGLDEGGFLRVKLKTDGRTISIQPDGNSFDITKNLIAMKSSH